MRHVVASRRTCVGVVDFCATVPVVHRVRCAPLSPLVVPFVLVAFAIVTAGCGQSPAPWTPHLDGGATADAEPFVCTVTAPTVCPDPAPRYPDVAPIFEERCAPCHYGAPGGPWSLRQYQQVADWYDTVRDHMINCTMPPVEYLPLLPLTNDERVAILTWILCGLPM
jgi:hypothetical protein